MGALKWASTRPFTTWSNNLEVSKASQRKILDHLATLKSHFKEARRVLKLIGNRADVGIEPDSQTDLADFTETLPGVLCCGVPGAGGVDAVFAIVLSHEHRLQVEKMWSKWH